GADEVVDHAVGVGVADVEARQLAIGDDVYTGQLLGLEDNEDGVAQVDRGRQGSQPGRDGVTANDSREDAFDAHGCVLRGDSFLLRRRRLQLGGLNDPQVELALAAGTVRGEVEQGAVAAQRGREVAGRRV